MPSSTMASRPGGDLLARGHDRVVFAGVVQGRGVAAPGHQLVGLAGHGGDHHRHVVAGIDLALDVARDVADALDIGDRGAAELHHQTGHGGLADLSGRMGAGNRALRQAPARKGAYTYRRGRASAQPRLGEHEPMTSQREAASALRRVDAAEVARFSALAAEWWDPRGKMARAAQVQSGAARLHPRRPRAGSSSRDGKRLDAWPGCASSTSAAAAASCREPLARLGAAVVGADPAAANIEVAQAACRRGRARDRLPRHHRRGAGRCRRALRRRARHGGGRARRRRGAVRARAAPRW